GADDHRQSEQHVHGEGGDDDPPGPPPGAGRNALRPLPHPESRELAKQPLRQAELDEDRQPEAESEEAREEAPVPRTEMAREQNRERRRRDNRCELREEKSGAVRRPQAKPGRRPAATATKAQHRCKGRDRSSKERERRGRLQRRRAAGFPPDQPALSAR